MAHLGGAGWVQALGDAVGAALVVGLLAPALSCARARVRVGAVPPDAVARADCTLSVDADRRVRVTALDPPGPASCLGAGAGGLLVRPERRGVYREVLVEVASAAPFGLLWWRRRVTLALPRELVVSPRIGPPVDLRALDDDRSGEGRRRARADAGEPRSVRSYRSGDQRRAVHWPATAHSGELAVKEMETPRAEPVVVSVHLPGDPDAAERLAERALGSVADLLLRGSEVVLATDEPGGVRSERVHSVVEAGRRLARADADPAGRVGVGAHRGPVPLTVDVPGAVVGAAADDGPARTPTSWLERIRRANAPGPPEHSVSLRVSCAGAVVCGIAAVSSQGEITGAEAVLSAVLVLTGMALSYRVRQRPLGWTKLLLALGALLSFAWFFHQLAGQQTADVATVENPLALLFVAVQVLHSFDVPARRDLAFSLAGSAILMAVASAQATDMGFALYVLPWLALAFWTLVGMWASSAEMRRVPAPSWTSALGATVVVAGGALLVLPAPVVGGNIDFPLNPGANVPLATPFGLAGDGPNASEPARPGTPAGASRVGGFTGFAERLDTALRGSLGDAVVMRVRANVPSYWVGETFDRWDGQSWFTSTSVPRILQSGSPFVIPLSGGGGGALAGGDLQTFYVVQSSPNLVFHADDAAEVWFPARSIFLRDDGTIVSPIALGSGAIYTVRSYPNAAGPAVLAADGTTDPVDGLGPADRRHYLQLPYAYPRAQALAESVTAGATSTYAKVQALIGWIGSHTRYSTTIPPIARGEDAVNSFLFTTRTGFCEQISSALAVMLRSLGIPAREAVGFVPGPYNPITDLYDIQAKDAHAWVEVWFPGYGWQSFDPTAAVPAANPAPGATALASVGHVLGRIPLAPVGGGLAVAGTAYGVALRRRRRPATWAERMARDLERAGRRSGRARRPEETLTEYAAALDERPGHAPGSWGPLAAAVESAAYGEAEAAVVRHEVEARWAAIDRRRLRRPRRRVRSEAAPKPRGRRGSRRSPVR